MPHGDVWRRKGMPKDEEHTIERGTNGDKVGIFKCGQKKKAAMKMACRMWASGTKESQSFLSEFPFLMRQFR